MIERFLRSPFTMCLFLIGLGAIYILGIVEENRGLAFQLITISYFLFVTIFFSLMVYYNSKNPASKIPIFTWIPYELKEEDEGHQYVTYKACRRVYIYYYFAIPFAIVLVTIFKFVNWMPIFVLAGLGLGQYLTYWSVIRKLQD
jgi:hypothetical protein